MTIFLFVFIANNNSNNNLRKQLLTLKPKSSFLHQLTNCSLILLLICESINLCTVPFKSKLTLDSRSLHESRIENRVKNRDSIRDDYVSILGECVSILDKCDSILVLDFCETPQTATWVLSNYRPSTLEFWNGLSESLNTTHLLYCYKNRPGFRLEIVPSDLPSVIVF